MKKVFFILGVMLSLGLFWACSSDDDMNNIGNDGMIPILKDSLVEERLKDIHEDDYTGHLSYEEWLKTWVISYYHPGSIDWVDIYYPMNLPDELVMNKEEGVDVSFSGKVVKMTDEDIKTLQIPLLGGFKYYYVYLTRIKKTE